MNVVYNVPPRVAFDLVYGVPGTYLHLLVFEIVIITATSPN